MDEGCALPARVIKRDGREARFDLGKIASAITRAGAATGEFGAKTADALTAALAARLDSRFGARAPGVEELQDLVELALLRAGHLQTARAYVVYREQHAKLRRDRNAVVDVAASINEYLEQQDWRVNANANQGYSLGGLILNVSGKVVANYWLSHVYAPEIGQAHREGDVHIHDLDMLSGYCAGWSLRTLLHEGLNGVPGKVEAGPPKHMSSAVGQIVNFLGTLQNEWAGAQAFSSFDTYMAPFVRADRMGYAEVKQCIQELVYNLNVPSRWRGALPAPLRPCPARRSGPRRAACAATSRRSSRPACPGRGCGCRPRGGRGPPPADRRATASSSRSPCRRRSGSGRRASSPGWRWR